MAVRYTYGNSSWGDLLTGWNGNTITSDEIGNMLSDGTRTYTWRNGRELAAMQTGSDDQDVSVSYTYNADGMRTKRTNGTSTYSYVYNGGSLSQLVISTATTADGTTTTATQTLNFAYDANGTPMAVTYGGTTYYYATNIQGDMVAILNASGAAVVTYTYNAWGNILTTTGTLASTLGIYNPLRYRGYVYDHETGLYYLQSRYYNPEMGRFINADAFASTGQGLLGNNMFAYCLNNPVCYVDPNGNLTKGQIHDSVLGEICFYNPELRMTNTCVYYNPVSNKKWGFCDLFNPNTGEVWELKRYSTAPSCQKQAALNQLGGYTAGCLKHYREVPLTAGTTEIASGIFTRSDKKGSYLIWYWDGGDGILFYDYIFMPRQSEISSALAIAGLSAGLGVIIGLCIYIQGIDTTPISKNNEDEMVIWGPFSNAA